MLNYILIFVIFGVVFFFCYIKFPSFLGDGLLFVNKGGSISEMAFLVLWRVNLTLITI